MPAEEGSGGYWAAVRYDDIRAVSRDPEHFISGRGVMLEDVPQEVLDAAPLRRDARPRAAAALPGPDRQRPGLPRRQLRQLRQRSALRSIWGR
jgi:hypothetical protein